MKRNTYLLTLLIFTPMLAIGASTFGPIGSPADSAQKSSALRTNTIRLTTRLHSKGLFAYGGRLVSDNPVIDFNLNYDRKNWGIQVFKALDLRDPSTPINFTLAVLNKNFRVGKRLTFTPSIGLILEQSRTFADHGSDAVIILITGYKISPAFTLEYGTLFGNLLLEPEMRDWVNRFRVLYTRGHFDVTLMGWHNNSLFDGTDYFTAGASAFYSRMKVSRSLAFNAGITALVMPYTSNEQAIPKKDGVFATVSMVFASH